MLRVSFSSEGTARSAVNVLAAYGYSASRSGRHLVTDCPPLLALPAMQKQVGFAQIESLDLKGRMDANPPGSRKHRQSRGRNRIASSPGEGPREGFA